MKKFDLHTKLVGLIIVNIFVYYVGGRDAVIWGTIAGLILTALAIVLTLLAAYIQNKFYK